MNDSGFAKKYKLHERHSATYWLAFLAFLESSVFLLPVDVIYLPMLLARPQKAYKYAFIATVFSVLGAMFGWVIGAFAYKTIAMPVLEFYDKTAYFEHLRSISNIKIIILFLLTSGLMHLPPIKLVNILAGLLHINLLLFFILNLSARALRLYGLAWLVTNYGARFKDFLRPYIQSIIARENRFRLVTFIIFALSSLVALTSFYLQYRAGFLPCRLCLIERYVFVLAGFISGAFFVVDAVLNVPWRSKYIVVCGLSAILFFNIAISVYHSGVERHWWAGPQSCSANSIQLAQHSTDLLQGLSHPHSPSCDVVAGHFLHLPFTAWSIIFSLLLFAAAIQLLVCVSKGKLTGNLQ